MVPFVHTSYQPRCAEAYVGELSRAPYNISPRSQVNNNNNNVLAMEMNKE